MIKKHILKIKTKPCALAKIKGSQDYPNVHGIVYFYKVSEGVLVSFKMNGLPVSNNICKQPIFAAHIHNGGSCTGNNSDPFANAMMHYNPNGCEHPYHAGDLPPLFSVDGIVFSVFLTNRFCVNEIMGKTLIIHSAPDDFTTQPSGNSGTKIACGIISPVH